MADTPTKKLFPTIPAAHWWTLRERFKRSIPSQLEGAMLASILNTQENSARANVMPGLRQIGLIDAAGKVNQELAARWRDDAEYATVCEEIRETVYPEGLLHTAPDPKTDRAAAERWFAGTTKQGTAAVTKMVSFYQLLSDARVAEPKERTQPTGRVPRTRQPTAAQLGVPATRVEPAAAAATPALIQEPPPPLRERAARSPSIHIDVQVHISADAKADQIDQIFASMAKHLYARTD
jgi:hypothetical protein